MEKLITVDHLERFKDKQEENLAQKYLEKITETSLPTGEGLYVGKQIFNKSDERLYIYTSKGWRAMPYADELVLEYTKTGNVTFKEV